ncbi:MAG: toll/interleukin-1 receptor domain-containing protein [Candidatus Methanoperedens sp.]|jgi:hypothetical protein
MPLFTESSIRTRAQKETRYFTADSFLTEQIRKQSSITKYDIFLSHAFDDKELILGLALALEDLGYAVYLDWRDDPSLNRNVVTSKTAERLRAKMKVSRCLLYATTEHASESRWMPWELGFKDGDNNRVAILPVTRVYATSYQGQEYLGVYPYISDDNDIKQKRCLWVNRSPTCYTHFDSWLAGYEPSDRK